MTTENKLQPIRMSDIKLQPVDWLRYPYLPFEKLAIIQGDPGEGKTTLALRLVAACSRGEALLGMGQHEPLTFSIRRQGTALEILSCRRGREQDLLYRRAGAFSFSAGQADRIRHQRNRCAADDPRLAAKSTTAKSVVMKPPSFTALISKQHETICFITLYLMASICTIICSIRSCRSLSELSDEYPSLSI